QHHVRASALLPVDAQHTLRMSVSPEAPAYRYAPGGGGNSAVLCRISGELVEHHGEGLTRLGTKHNIGSVNSDVAECGIGCGLVLHEFRKRDALPATVTQQLMGDGHRFDPPLESGDELGHRAARLLRAGSDRGNGCEHILDAVVELANQRILVIFKFLAL